MIKTQKIKGRLLGAVINITNTLEKGRDMQDLYKEFSDWMTYNYPGIKLGPVQEDLMRMALRNWNVKVTKTAGKAIIKEVANLIVTETETKSSA